MKLGVWVNHVKTEVDGVFLFTLTKVKDTTDHSEKWFLIDILRMIIKKLDV